MSCSPTSLAQCGGMPGARFTPRVPAAGARSCGGVLPRLACGVALVGAAFAPLGPLSFALVPGQHSAAVGQAVPWVAASAAERLDTPRGEREPLTQLRGRYKEGTRSRKNQQGGGRLPIRMNRKPVLAYSITITDEPQVETKEPGSSVLRRMWDMYDMDFNKMAAERQRYFRPPGRKAQWESDFRGRLNRRTKIRNTQLKQEAEWLDWMRREGRKLGLTEPIPYTGPPLKLTPEEEAASEPEAMKKRVGGEENFKRNILPNLPKGKERLPKDIEPGQWNDEGPENIFKIWRRPLCKWPYDIGKRGRWGPVVRGIVM
mmetsp:Transcript_87785/g.271844  ORF Transcript_87785/g.271844 Transcript_87785/m.271844 type:complete len:316 (-) Transcript_87785:59-1006(-)